MLPSIELILDNVRVVALPLAVPFRGITTREVALIEGPSGWGEYAPFVEYDDLESSVWLQSAIETAWVGLPAPQRDSVPINATVPAVPADEVPAILARFPGASTAKVKVAAPGDSLDDIYYRVNAVRELIPNVRVDANGAWTVNQARTAIAVMIADGPLEYVEQPCRTAEELAELRRVEPYVRIAADESIRRADDPFRVAALGGCDIAVLKVAPLGGPRRTLAIAEQLASIGIDSVISSALDSAVGITAGYATAAALPELNYACGLGTGEFFADNVSRTPTPDELTRLAASEERREWWIARLQRCHDVLQREG